jgi:pentatricopeptide repeat protein
VYRPDEGLILDVLNVAARWGRPDLATQALAKLSELNVQAQEYHLVALLESYVVAGRVPEALRVVSSIREMGMTPTLSTVEPIAAVLTTAEIIDQAFYGIEDMHKAGETIDIASLNALILACARIGDLRRARATQTAIGDFGLKPNLDTYNLLLEACIAAEHRALGDTLLSEMAAANLTPAESTYERVIQLCLVPEDYDDAFFYLEKMKAEGLQPSSKAYIAILRRCLKDNDRRWILVREEMDALDYTLDFDTRRMISQHERR